MSGFTAAAASCAAWISADTLIEGLARPRTNGTARRQPHMRYQDIGPRFGHQPRLVGIENIWSREEVALAGASRMSSTSRS